MRLWQVFLRASQCSAEVGLSRRIVALCNFDQRHGVENIGGLGVVDPENLYRGFEHLFLDPQGLCVVPLVIMDLFLLSLFGSQACQLI